MAVALFSNTQVYFFLSDVLSVSEVQLNSVIGMDLHRGSETRL